MTDMPSIMTPDDFQIWTRGELARIDQLHADAERKRQEMQLAPAALRYEMWKAVAAMVGTIAGSVLAMLALLKYLNTGIVG
jgi:hypothetical protein